MMYNPQLETFICVADAGSFNKAAEQLYISAPAVIKQINSLEGSLGLQLFGNGVLSGLGLEWTELMILAVSILFSAWVTIHNQKEDMRVTLEKKPIWLRWIALYALLFYVILLGKYGPGYSASEFIYQNFKV